MRVDDDDDDDDDDMGGITPTLFVVKDDDVDADVELTGAE